MWPTSTSRSKHFHTSLKLPLHALINDPQKKRWWASTRAHDPFFNILKIWPTFIYRGEVPGYTFPKLPVCALINDPKKFNPKNSLCQQTHHLVMWPTSTSRSKHFHTSLKLPLHALINDPQKKRRWASTRAHDPFFNILKIWPTFIYRGEVPGYTFPKLPVCALINDPKKFNPKNSLQQQTHHLVMWPTSTSRSKHFCTSLKLPLGALINDPQKKRWWASTRAHDAFFNILKIWPIFIYRGEVPSNTFAKLPVHALINDPKKFNPKTSLYQQTHHLVMWPTSTSRSKCFCTSLKLPLHALIHDLQKKRWRASTRPHDPFFDILKIWPTFIYRGEVPSNTFAKLPVHALINDPKKFNPKNSLYQ